MAQSPRELVRWDQTYSGEAVVEPGWLVSLTGTVLGDVVVRSGGNLHHQGCITGKLGVEAGGSVNVGGMTLGDTRAVNARDVTLDGYGPMPEGDHPDPIFVGPDGWHQLDEVWRECVIGIDAVIDVASVGAWVGEMSPGEPSTDLAVMIALAALSMTDRSARRLWALLAAAIYNIHHDLQVSNRDGWSTWSPHDLMERIPWDQVGTFWDGPPALFTQLLSLESPQRFDWAMDLYDLISSMAYAVFAIGAPPPPDSIDRVEAFRSQLLDELAAASPPATDGSTASTGGTFTFSGPLTSAEQRRFEAVWSAEDQRRLDAAGGGEQPRGAAALSAVDSPGIDEEANPVEAAMVKLNQLIGLASVKDEIRQLGGQAKIFAERRRRDLKVPVITRHIVMTGNPGTGKTTVARLLGMIYWGYGILEKPDVVSKAREDLVAIHVGKTAPLTKKAFVEALGGVLFIDEAYRLTPRGESDFGQEAVNTLVPLMEDHRGEIMVVAAGYPKDMAEFLEVNPGLAGRFGQTIVFPDYSDDELLEVLLGFCRDEEYVLTDEAQARFKEVLKPARTMLGRNFDNARLARRAFEGATRRSATRVYDATGGKERTATTEQLKELIADDIPSAEKLVVKRDDEDPS